MIKELISEVSGGAFVVKSVGSAWKDRGFEFFRFSDHSTELLIHPSIWEKDKEEVVIKRFHRIFLFLQTEPFLKISGEQYKYCFYCGSDSSMEYFRHPQAIDAEILMKDYPKTFMETVEKSLLNLSREFKDYGVIFSGGNRNLYHLLYASNKDTIEGQMQILLELGYLNCIKKESEKSYRISANGWKRISELEHEEVAKQGFIAMAFKDDTKLISDAFKKVIDRCGYIPKRIDEKEHNRQIVPEILFEISRSKFVVVDITYPNYGAYYEAGYAEALGKEVIICCRQKEFQGDNKPHFDIAQKSSVIWKDEEDLEERLYKRIEATVGLNQ